MSKLIALCDGHGIGTPGKRTPHIPELGRSIMENEFNREVVKYLDMELRHNGFRTLLVAPTDYDTPLKQRTDLANKNKADLYISIHFNALDGKFDGSGKDPEGFSAHIYHGKRNTESGQFAKIALKHLSKGTPQRNRGIVEQNLHVVRETRMPAVLFELGFMDNEREARLMLNVDFQKECAIELAMAVCEFYGVKYKSGAVSGSTEVTPKAPDVDQIYRVRKSWGDGSTQKGAFQNLNNAKKVADANKGYKVFDVKGNVVYDPHSTKTTTPSDNSERFTVASDTAGYSTAADAKAGKNKKTTVKKGTYYVFNKSQGMINVSSKKGVPGSWINPNAIKSSDSGMFRVTKSTDGYSTAADAKAGRNRKGTVEPGNYYVFNRSQGMVNVSSKKGVPGSWINPNNA